MPTGTDELAAPRRAANGRAPAMARNERREMSVGCMARPYHRSTRLGRAYAPRAPSAPCALATSFLNRLPAIALTMRNRIIATVCGTFDSHIDRSTGVL